MTNSESEQSEGVSFPSFHDRTTELTDADKARVRLAAAIRQLILDSFMSTARIEDIDASMRLVVFLVVQRLNRISQIAARFTVQ